jgi:hypothetical protein
MSICRQADPPDIEVDGRVVKCYLYTDDNQEANQEPINMPQPVKLA